MALIDFYSDSRQTMLLVNGELKVYVGWLEKLYIFFVMDICNKEIEK